MAQIARPAYPWYGLATGSDLGQGDILRDCPAFLIQPGAIESPGDHPVTVLRQNAIVMSQSCDLTLGRDASTAVDDVILAPIYSRQELAQHRIYGKPLGWEEARKGRHVGYHVLNRCELPGHETEFMLVDLRRIFTLSIEMVRELAGERSPRLRLFPSYREHLSQAFARFFMRVGLPVDIEPFK